MESGPRHQVANMAPESRKRQYAEENSTSTPPQISEKKTLSLETLPSVILDEIFSYIQSPELLQLMLLSKDLYSPAARIVYRSITITDSTEFSRTKEYAPNWRINSGTLLPYQRLKSLVSTLETNKELGEMVRTMTLYNLVIKKGKLLTEFLSLIPNLEAFHNTSNFLIPEQVVKKLSTLTCLLEHACTPLSNIRELRIIDLKASFFKPRWADEYIDEDEYTEEEPYDGNSDEDLSENDDLLEGDDLPEDDDLSPRDSSSDDDDSFHRDDPELYRRLARNLVSSRGCVGLRKLHISSGQDNVSEQFSASEYSESWTAFFDELNRMKVTLSLDSLAVHGVAIGKAQDTAKQIQGSINLRNLKQLILVEKFDKPADALLLKFITQHTPNLKSLAVFFTSEDPDLRDSYELSHVECLAEVLQKFIPDQLEELAVVMDTDNWLDRDDVQYAIIPSQKNLVRLRIDNGWPLGEIDNGGDLEWLSAYAEFDMRDEAKRQLLFPRVIGQAHSRPYGRNQLVRGIIENLWEIRCEFQNDTIYRSAQNNFPVLRQYYLGGAFVDPKMQGIYINDRMASLDGPEEDDDVYRNKYEVTTDLSEFDCGYF